jgi:AcrR family transcriptional regulator
MIQPDPRPASAHQQRVLQAACTLFLRDGYRVSMSAVAREAGVSKQTVYAHYATKDGLFTAAVEQLVQPLHASLHTGERSLADTLYGLASAHQSNMMDPSKVALGRMLIAEAPRFPTAARMLFRTVVENVLRRLAEHMREAMTRGHMREDDPDTAAELFLSMLHGMEGDRRLFGVRGRSQKAQDAWARHAVTIFLQAYAIAPGRPSALPQGPGKDASPNKNPEKRTESP